MDAEQEEKMEKLMAQADNQGLDSLGDMQVVNLLTLLEDKQDELKAQLDELEDAADEVKEKVLDIMVENGVDKVTARGMTAYIHEQTYTSVKGKQHAEAARRLQNNGLEELITIGPGKLSAYVRRQENGLEDLPPDLQEILTTYTKRQIRVRSS